MGAPEPVLLTRGLVLVGAARVIKEKHICLPLGQDSRRPSSERDGLEPPGRARPGRSGSPDCRWPAAPPIDLVFRLRENTHPQYGGLELELIDLSHRLKAVPDSQLLRSE